MTLSLMPKDLPLPVETYNEVLVPANATNVDQSGPEGITGYDPWTHANTALMSDRSQPEQGPYGEPSYAKAKAITGEVGGMPSPVKYFSDQTGMVLLVRRPVRFNEGVTGAFYGPQQTAWEAGYVDPTTDYWSVIIGQE